MGSFGAWFAMVLAFLSTLPQSLVLEKKSKLQPVVPEGAEFIAGLKDALAAGGLDTFAVFDPKAPPLYAPDEKRILLLTDDKRFIRVWVFPGETDAEQVSVLYARTAENGKHHRYRIEGWPVGAGGTVETFQPQYYTLYGRWLIETEDAGLDFRIKTALGLAGPRAEPPRPPCVQPRIS